MQDSHLNSANIPVGMMDLDSDLTLVDQKDATYALNIRNGYGSIVGRATNVKGIELVSFPLPAGVNTCIGTCEDKRGESVLYFVHNSNGEHQIYRYLSAQSLLLPIGEIIKIAQGSTLEFRTDWLITHAHLVDGKLLYWTDAYTDKQTIEGNPPRKINIERGNTRKKLTYNVYAGIADQGQYSDALVNNTQLAFQFYDKATGVPTAATAIIPASILQTLANDPDAILGYIADVINILFSTFATAEFCDCTTTIEVREDLTLDIFEVNAPLPNIMFVAGNHYPSPLQEWHIDLVKYPPIFEPQPAYQINTAISYNNVNQSTFQFRVRYYYTDGEKSAWGPISLVPLNTETDGTFLQALNEIKVGFTDERLNDESFLAMVQFVEVAFREGNLGTFRSIEIIPTCRIGVRGEQFVLFRNDKLYSIIASDDATQIGTAQVIKLFDSVPRLTGCIENVADRDGDSRLFTGANLENFDCPDCIGLEFEVSSEVVDDCAVTIKGVVNVFDWDYAAQIPIPGTPSPITPATTFSFFGMNLGGFVVYLVGTNYYAVSDSPMDGTGTGEFEIKNVPRGRYILRVASYMCSYDNRNGSTSNLNNGLAWQRTSSPVLDCAGSQTATAIRFERYIDLTAPLSNTFDLMVEPGYGDIKILNLAYDQTAIWIGIDGYLLDNNALIDTDPLIYSVRKGAIGTELQRVLSDPQPGNPLKLNNSLFVYPNDTGLSDNMVTDHNGYFFFLSGYNPADYIGLIDWSNAFYFKCADVCDTDPSIYRQLQPENYYGGALGGVQKWGLQGLDDELLENFQVLTLADGLKRQVLLYSVDTEFTENNKTQVNGSLKDSNGGPKENILVALERNGRQEYTGVNGNYSITIYCPYNSFSRTENIIATYLADICYQNPITPTPPQVLNIGLFCDDYNSTTPFPVPDFTVQVSVGIIQTERYLKRGASYNTGIVYEDRANRKCTVSKTVNQLYIPFFTEIGEYSKPITTWSINSQPPDWATHYRIVRSKNTVYRRYIHASIQTARYVRIDTPQTTPADTSFANGDATHILISLAIAVGSDETTNPVSFFFLGDNGAGYEAEVYDRIRFISDETGTVFSTGVQENEVVGRYVESETYYFVIKNPETFQEVKQDWLIEVYSPKRNEEVAFYEVGETYPIINPHTPNRAHGGQIQNQIIAPLFLVQEQSYPFLNLSYTSEYMYHVA